MKLQQPRKDKREKKKNKQRKTKNNNNSLNSPNNKQISNKIIIIWKLKNLNNKWNKNKSKIFPMNKLLIKPGK